MTFKAAVILLELGVLGAAAPVCAEDLTKKPAQVTVTSTERMSFAPGGMIRVEDSIGYVNVEGWDKPEVEITLTKSMPYDYKLKKPDEARKHLDSIQIATERKSDTELAISTILPRRRSASFKPNKNFDPLPVILPRKTSADVRVEYEIHAPRDSKLVIHHGVGSVTVIDIAGDIEASAGRGDIMLMLRDSGSYAIDAKSKFGTVISDFDGSTKLNRYRLGERYATADSTASRRIHLRMGFGGITISAVPLEVHAPESAK
jgi:hypothetical protein